MTVSLPCPIHCIEAMNAIKGRAVPLILVALANGEIRCYNDRYIISVITLQETVTGMRFGRYTREDNTLVIACRSGALRMQILSRQSNLEKPAFPNRNLSL